MSNKQNLAEELTEKWQKDLQNAIQDPKVIELMNKNISQATDLMQKYASNFSQNSQPTADDSNGNDKLHQLEQRIDSLEARLAILEKYVTSTSK